MSTPGFTAELALQERSKIAFWALRPAASAVAEITPQLFIRLPVGGGGIQGCSSCGDELARCRAKCDADPKAGYFCYFDCRLEYIACLIRCAGGGSWSGNGFIY
jgi:hypothetical protein